MATSQPAAKKRATEAVPDASELVSFEHGAAGHQGISSNASGSLLIKPCVQAEIDFYESAKEHPLFQAHMPTFIGSLMQNDDEAESAETGASTNASAGPVVTDPTPGLIKRATWKPSGGKKLSTGLAIVLENTTHGFKHPNVLDVKLGARLWDDAAPGAKRKTLDDVAASTTSGSLGFRVAGMKVHLDGNGGDATEAPEPNVEIKNGAKSYNKHYGRTFDKDSVVDAFTTYLGGVTRNEASGGKVEFKKRHGALIAKRMIRELESIQYVLENQESRMYSASVLWVYEGDDEALEAGLKAEEEGDGKEEEDEEGDDHDDDDDEVVTQKVLEARLIDFAHAKWTPGEGPDENALHGIRSQIQILKGLVG
ncbi:hypothetical protein LTR84_005524 [Exophiala bonariae]|uniref:Kinase n=1 Tax=Exophiala bonariae TaxID=1690606 RepID=A0AAV9N422_9EURO|nr:hypothetical protein LTR84_005524 [Exophiala bonariae]